MLGIENIIGKGRRPSVEVLVETATSAMEALPTVEVGLLSVRLREERDKKTEIKSSVSFTEKSISALLCTSN